MSRKGMFFLFSIFSIVFFSCSDTSFNSSEHDKAIQNEMDQLNSSYLFYIKSLRTNDKEDIELKQQNTLKQIKLSLAQLNKLPKTAEDENYLKAAINYVYQLEKSITITDKAYIELLKKDNLLTKEDSLQIKNLVNERLYNCDKAFLEFQFAQNKFREKFKIKSGKNQN